jgi:hypothetical protein
MKTIKEKNNTKIYVVEYWFLLFMNGEDMGYDFEQVEVQAISPASAIKKVKSEQKYLLPIGAKNFKVIRYYHK